MHNYFNHDEQFKTVFDALEEGVYIFGHSHIQWSYKSDDGKKLLINPGSCGLPLDCIEDGVPYTILDISNMDNLMAEEIRVPFDKDAHIDIFMKSDQYKEANVWTKIIVKEIKTNREHMRFFLDFVTDYAIKIGDTKRPFSVSTWEKAFEIWKEKYII